jgi:hypothetical protein
VELLTGDRHTYLSLTDNGTGIDDPAILLTLGDSDWEEETQNREDPAGMGIFSLANRGAEIHSNGWSVRLEPSHFCGISIKLIIIRLILLHKLLAYFDLFRFPYLSYIFSQNFQL